MFREAVMLHYLDDLDSKMAAVRSILASENGEAEWTDRSGALERRILRVERYMNTAQQSANAADSPGAPPAAEQLSLVPAVEKESANTRGASARSDAAAVAAKPGAAGRSW
jgi:hypothetical protein